MLPMSTLEIKKKLINEINEVEDIQLLNALYRILTAKKNEEVYQLSKEQVAAIEEAQEQYSNGRYFSNDEVDQEIEEWLKK